MNMLIIFITGFIAAVSGGFWGIGGGVVVVPALLLMGMGYETAVSASLLQMMPTSFLTVARQFRGIGWKRGGYGLTVALPLVVSCFVGGMFGKPVGVWIENYFGMGRTPHQIIYLMLLAWVFYTIIGETRDEPHGAFSGSRRIVLTIVSGYLTGVVAALLGIGGGALTRPLMRNFLGVPERETAAVARLCVTTVAASGTLSYFFRLPPDYIDILKTGFCLAAGGVIGFALGAKMHSMVLRHGGGGGRLAHKSFAAVVAGIFASLALKIAGCVVAGQAVIVLTGIVLVIMLAAITARAASAAKPLDR